MSFKVGDIVEVIDPSGAGGLARLGDRCKVIAFEEGSEDYIHDHLVVKVLSDGREYGMRAHRFKLAGSRRNLPSWF